MRAKDVMTVNPVSVGPDATVPEIAEVLLEHRISGVPVVDVERHVLGVVSEGDLMRRPEIMPRRRAWWLAMFTGEQPDAEFVKTHGRFAHEVMTSPAIAVEEEVSIEDIAQLLEERGIKRVPVLRDGKLVGIVSRADLLRALAAGKRPPRLAAALNDRTLREAILAEMAREKWPLAGVVNVVVSDGTVHFWGMLGPDEDPRALVVLAENVPGVQAVHDYRARVPQYV